MAILAFGDFFVFTNHIRSTRFIIGNLRKEEFVMNKEEAFKAMKEGKKVSHKYFNSKEWMTLTKDGLIEFEDGVVCEQGSRCRIDLCSSLRFHSLFCILLFKQFRKRGSTKY